MSVEAILGSAKCHCSNLTVATLSEARGCLITDDLVALQESAEAEEEACTFCQLSWSAMKERYPRHYKRWLKDNVAYREAEDKKKARISNGWESGVRVRGKFTFELDQIRARGDVDESTASKPELVDRIARSGSLLALFPERKDRHPISPTLGVFA